MNEDKVKDIIGKLVLKNRLERQYPASKRNLAKLEELGLLKFMPTCNHPSVRGQIGQTDANRVIEEAGKAPGAVMNAYGEGEQTDGSDLWLALNETAETDEPELRFEKKLNASFDAPILVAITKRGVVVREFTFARYGVYRDSGAPWGTLGKTRDWLEQNGFAQVPEPEWHWK